MQYENVIFLDSVGFLCRNCGTCCREQPPDISFKEQQRIQNAGYKNFMQESSVPNNRKLRRNKDGSCFFFSDQNTCKINYIKPSVCILEPFVITNFDYRSNKIFLKLNPLAAKNCKGILTKENVSIVEIGKAAQSIVQDVLEIVGQKTGLPVTDKKVGALTRKLLRETR
ncbi:MAG: YkgJ family cysteine cluster protein [Candidatus Bathyarchaeia archaeon]